MNTTSSLKVTVNGKKYLITGIQKETSCKDLLCAIAKATRNNLQVIKEERLEEKALRAVYGVKTSEINCEGNILEKLKGDSKLVGDYESLKIFNSLGKNAKIIAKETVTVKKELGLNGLSQVYKKRKKKGKTKDSEFITEHKERRSTQDTEKRTKDIKHKSEEKEKKSHKQKFKRETKKLVPEEIEVTRKHKIKHRSKDDSDIDTYKHDTLTRIKKRSNRVHDDSDVDVYQSLFQVVIDQTKTLNKIQSQSKEARKTAWIKELQSCSQVYYLDDEKSKQTNPNEHNMETIACEKDDGNDSGLPSPEYDSCESQDNQPTILKQKLSHDLFKDTEIEQIQDKKIDNVLKEKVAKGKQSIISNQNNIIEKDLNVEQNCCNLQNDKSDQCDNEQNKNTLNTNFIVESKPDQTLKTKDDISINFNCCSKSLQSHDVAEKQNLEESGNLMSSEPLNTNKSSLQDDFLVENNGIDIILDSNKNIIPAQVSEGDQGKMVAFDAALLQRSISNNNKKHEKKKIRKSDISNPILLSPSAFKRHKSLKKIESLLGVRSADVLTEEVIANAEFLPPIEKEMERKDKEKIYNKRLKEIRKSKKTKSGEKGKCSKSKLDEPEYLSKATFEEILLPNDRVKEVIEVNVFEKKDKNKSKKGKNVELNGKLNGELPKLPNASKPTEDMKVDDKTSVGLDNNITHLKANEKGVVKVHVKVSEKVVIKINHDKTVTQNYEVRHPNIESQNMEKVVSKNKHDTKDTCQHNNNVNLSSRLENKKNIENSINSSSTADNNKSSTINESHVNCSSKLTTSSLEAKKDPIPSTDNKLENPSEDNENKRLELIEEYMKTKQAVNDLIHKILDYNLLISQLAEELDILSNEENKNNTVDDLEKQERNLFIELEGVKCLLRSVADLTAYQRKEIAEHLTLLDQLDLELRTKKAGYENLKTGVWKTNSNSAPRSLIKHSREKRKSKRRNGISSSNVDNTKSSSFV